MTGPGTGSVVGGPWVKERRWVFGLRRAWQGRGREWKHRSRECGPLCRTTGEMEFVKVTCDIHVTRSTHNPRETGLGIPIAHDQMYPLYIPLVTLSIDLVAKLEL